MEDRLIVGLMNTENVPEEAISYILAGDISVVVYYVFKTEKDGGNYNARLVQKELAEHAFKTKDMEEAFRVLIRHYEEEMDPIVLYRPFAGGTKKYETEEDKKDMLAITNVSFIFGAGSILSPAIQDELMKHYKANFFIIPSSIHEIITCPIDEYEEFFVQVKSIEDIIKEINSSFDAVRKNEILSNQLYLFDITDRKIKSVSDFVKSQDLPFC